MEDGLIDAKLGGHVVKTRVALPGHGKRGSARSLVVYQQNNKAFSSTVLQRMNGQILATRN